MDNSTPQNELLMKYLDDEMTSAEKEEFEKRLSDDADLQQEFENLLAARQAVRMYGLKHEVHGMHQQMMRELRPGGTIRRISSTRRIVRYSLSVAASLLVLVIGIVAYNFYKLSSERLYNDQYHLYELSSLRGNENRASELEKAYQEKKYNEVIADRRALTNPSAKDLFLSGIAYLETGNAAAAINSFKSVIEKNRTGHTAILNDEAEYYLALSYLRNKNYDQALDLMRAIRSNPGHLYHDQFSRSFVRKVSMLKWR
jgi:tetratricopeptide (TPR) repeat protein